VSLAQDGRTETLRFVYKYDWELGMPPGKVGGDVQNTFSAGASLLIQVFHFLDFILPDESG
jgi:hypothetical protein